MRFSFTFLQLFFYASLLILSVGCKSKVDEVLPFLQASSTSWREHPDNPIISYNDKIEGILWNDPSVVKDGSGYRIWLSGGRPFETPIRVNIYQAYSEDGLSWDIKSQPVLEAGLPHEWDGLRVETPSVIKVGSTYHMYYSGCRNPCDSGQYDIGHATSRDGNSWIKNPKNPIIRKHDDPLRWGFYTAAEPAVIYYNGLFYLYYVAAKSNHPEKGAPFSIMLATSENGEDFKLHGSVHRLSEAYDPSMFRGYSTPSVILKDGVFHLYYDVIYNLDGFEQVAISYATSLDGFEFEEQATNIIKISKDWKDTSVLAPSVLNDNGRVKMWFSGQNSSPEFNFGIGYAEKH